MQKKKEPQRYSWERRRRRLTHNAASSRTASPDTLPTSFSSSLPFKQPTRLTELQMLVTVNQMQSVSIQQEHSKGPQGTMGTNWPGMVRTAQNRVRWRGVVDGLCSTRSDGHKYCKVPCKRPLPCKRPPPTSGLKLCKG